MPNLTALSPTQVILFTLDCGSMGGPVLIELLSFPTCDAANEFITNTPQPENTNYFCQAELAKENHPYNFGYRTN